VIEEEKQGVGTKEMMATEGEHLKMWQDRWKTAYQTERPGFHQISVNENLIAFREELLAKPTGNNILVPLCGKALDLIYLTQHGFVGGVEIAQEAIDQFAREQVLTYDEEVMKGSGNRLFAATVPKTGNQVAIGKFDFFNLPDGWSDNGASGKHKFNACFDRASLVAIDPPMRKQYVQVMLEQLTEDGRILLVVFDHETHKSKGPPHSVNEQEVHELYGEHFDIKLLKKETTPVNAIDTITLTFLLTRKK